MWKRNTSEHAGMRTITPLLRVLASLRIHGIENDRGMRRRSASCGVTGDWRDGDGPHGPRGDIRNVRTVSLVLARRSTPSQATRVPNDQRR